MDIILIPGLWLDAASWNDVVPALQAAGHRTHALTLPGVGAAAESSRDIGIADWVASATATLDSIGRPAVVVGHSGGGNVAWGVADARPDRVSRVVLVDTVPPPTGYGISEFEIVDGVIPFPGWDFFPEDEVRDLDAPTRERTAARALSVPARVPTDRILLEDSDRFRVPVTLLMGGADRAALEAELENWGPYAEEFRRIADVEVIPIGSGHWPQFTAPARLAALVDAAASR
ncbi:alpha/beta fold hydrolase [Microbacterium sp. ZW T5_45]|uniref:alpha/beta fold hydrolase n=1 Tax=Microbacterium sp. ZW T5_45 TaxID=3378080 RepID=UPI00385212BC